MTAARRVASPLSHHGGGPTSPRRWQDPRRTRSADAARPCPQAPSPSTSGADGVARSPGRLHAERHVVRQGARRRSGGARRSRRRGRGRPGRRPARTDADRAAGRRAVRSPRPGPGRAGQLRRDLAGPADHRKPAAGRAAQARFRVRPGHRLHRARRRRDAAARAARWGGAARRTGARRHGPAGARGPARCAGGGPRRDHPRRGTGGQRAGGGAGTPA